MKAQDPIYSAFKHLDLYVQKENFKGWDPFDGLNSTLFKGSFFYRSALLRLIWIQFFKKSPLNLRYLTKVPTGYNAKGLGLFVSGLVANGRVQEANFLLKKLKNMTCNGFQGASWGYNFDWQARAFFVPTGKPNIVTSVFVANAFLDYFDAARDQNALALGEDACDFILNHLIQYEDKNSLCFGYIPGETARVHNANMLGAALLARVYSYTKKNILLKKSRKAMAYSMGALNPDYSWPYGELHHHQFIDNFHTGFNLVALKEWMDYTGDRVWEGELVSAYQYFLAMFWLNDGTPKYYHNSLYPIDIHCSAQGIVTCLKLAEFNDQSLELAEKIAVWAIENMRDDKGWFHYQKTRYFTNKIPYIRWSQAWMYYALSLFLNKKPTPKKSL
jgi:hypothetical protein